MIERVFSVIAYHSSHNISCLDMTGIMAWVITTYDMKEELEGRLYEGKT